AQIGTVVRLVVVRTPEYLEQVGPAPEAEFGDVVLPQLQRGNERAPVLTASRPLLARRPQDRPADLAGVRRVGSGTGMQANRGLRAGLYLRNCSRQIDGRRRRRAAVRCGEPLGINLGT